MNYAASVLNKLLDKYEVRTMGSNRRVRIVCSKNEVTIPDIESPQYADFRNDMLLLKDKEFIELDWVRKDYIINSIWLNLGNVENAYSYLDRKDNISRVGEVVAMINDALLKVGNNWIRNYLESVKNNILLKRKLSGIFGGEHILLNNFLRALINIDQLCDKSISMRAFSVNVYGDSKFFEREIKQYIIPVIKNYEPSLSDIEEMSDREILAQVGIIMMPEIFEFCGNVRINFNGGTVDFSPIKNGACVSSESVSEMRSAEIFDTERIIFIENKTNFTEYCINAKSVNEFVIYHGGFYSPQRGEFFRKLCGKTDIPVYFWGDIDYGGFKMFVRLKNNIIHSLQPLNMDIASYNQYKNNGLKKNDDYISKLKMLSENPDYDVFSDVISAIAEEKSTVEQESFLDRNSTIF